MATTVVHQTDIHKTLNKPQGAFGKIHQQRVLQMSVSLSLESASYAL